MSTGNHRGWFRDTPESRRLLEIERAKVEAAEAEFVAQATARLEALLERLPDSSHVTAAKDDLRAILAENREMRRAIELADGMCTCSSVVAAQSVVHNERAEAHRMPSETQEAP